MLTFPQAKRLVAVALSQFYMNTQKALEIVIYHTRRNFIAYQSHRRKRLMEMKMTL